VGVDDHRCLYLLNGNRKRDYIESDNIGRGLQMSREELIRFLVAEIAGRKKPGRPFRAGIDGRCASGKSALANELAVALAPRGWDVLRPSVDGFHHARERRYQKGEYSVAGYYYYWVIKCWPVGHSSGKCSM
jgi:hypothetical protein